jgi:hypothetical protein
MLYFQHLNNVLPVMQEKDSASNVELIVHIQVLVAIGH